MNAVSVIRTLKRLIMTETTFIYSKTDQDKSCASLVLVTQNDSDFSVLNIGIQHSVCVFVKNGPEFGLGRNLIPAT